MSPPDRKQNEVRRMLDGGHAPLPADLALRATLHGDRLLRRRQVLRAVLWTLALVAVFVFAAWAATAQPWEAPPSHTTPPVYRW